MLAIVTHWHRFAASDRGRMVLRALRGLFWLGMLGYLGYKLVHIGWAAIWASLPRQPLFYLLFLALYFLLPLAEVVMYKVTWPFAGWRSIPAFVKKRIYNKEVMGYAGEVYFFTWARRHVALPEAELAKTIRDNNILSSAASTLVALGLLGVFLYLGHLRLTDVLRNEDVGYWMGAGILMALLVPVGLRFRKYLFSMAAKTALVIFALQCGRLVLGQVLQIGQWAVVMPSVPLGTWFTFAAISIILTRIPFLPNQNLVFMGVGVELSTSLGVPEAAMFSMLGVITALDKLLSFGLFVLFSLKKEEAAPEVDRASVGEWVVRVMTRRDPSGKRPAATPEDRAPERRMPA
ncbi:hypothetical protein GQ464_009490 [Rhodocaloribacter litoris]|uniref:hypothetical protein n=1 Tax=Rhodocaloribacter litoris TaxID=2558931 RepID=UPI001420C7C7|nr:hypothetical protein [Rhodocaloribacter litoris]QXD13713.1 hypothetical protein GQ464_009490 [Rhodocaloribacter litoris]GIV61046.1 MAG: hypothetical protein KatS3mg043_2135 [Rhodothermaceae bacterium]